MKEIEVYVYKCHKSVPLIPMLRDFLPNSSSKLRFRSWQPAILLPALTKTRAKVSLDADYDLPLCSFIDEIVCSTRTFADLYPFFRAPARLLELQARMETIAAMGP